MAKLYMFYHLPLPRGTEQVLAQCLDLDHGDLQAKVFITNSF
jgi:hypothetical protein